MADTRNNTSCSEDKYFLISKILSKQGQHQRNEISHIGFIESVHDQ